MVALDGVGMAAHEALKPVAADDVVAQEPPLSTTTAASSHVASLSSGEDDEDGLDGASEDADDEDSDNDVLHIISEDEDEAKPERAPTQDCQDRASVEAEVGDDDAHDDAAAPHAPARFSLISIPSRVRASVFSRKPRKVEEPVKEEPAEEDEQENTQFSLTEEKPLDSPDNTESPASAGIALPSLTSFTSLTKSFSQRTISEDDASSVNAENGEKFKSFWDDKLRTTMDRIAHRSKTDSGAVAYEQQRSQLDVFHLVLKLYAHQDVIEELYASYEANAAEFEFYIPQLCTFLLHGNYEKQHQLECFLMSRSGESLVFAHRLGWFLKSFCGDARGYQSEYLSVVSSPEEENADLLIAIQQRGGVPAVLMEQGLNLEEVCEPGPNLMLRRASSFDIDAAAEMTNMKSKRDDDASFAAFLRTKRNWLLYEAMPEEGNEQQIALYNATPDFVTQLTDLADRLIPVPLANRNTELRQELVKINEKCLPSNVIYLPIGNTHHRVKGIQVEECFTFSTKERVPYLLCVEVIDYSVRAKSEHTEKIKTPLIARRRSKKFGLKLRFKKAREPAPIVVARVSSVGRPSDLASAQELLDGLDSIVETPRYPQELMFEDESKTEDPSELRQSVNYDLFDSSALALTPGQAYEDDKVAVQMEVDVAHDGDDEKEKAQESTDSEQKKLLGQWGLPRVRRRSKAVRPSAPKSSSKFDSFYLSWFAKKQKVPSLENSVSTSLADTEQFEDDSMIGTPLMATSIDNQDDPSDEVALEDAPPDADHTDSELTEPVPEPLASTKSTKFLDSSDDELPKQRSRDMSVSLDFTDAYAWKVNFDLEDVPTDAEPEVTVDVHTPELTPEIGQVVVADQDNNNEVADDAEECDGEGEEFEDEKPIIVFRERWSEKEDRIRKESPLGTHPGWRLLPVIVKSNDDLRQEQFAAQLIAQCDRIFKGYSLPLRLRPYNVIATSAKTGLIEAVPNTVSLDSLKRNDPSYTTLLDFYERLFGTDSDEFRLARRNFVESLAAYSIVCYVFQIKDRHNGNILLDTEGHVIHIDFGFLLTNSPGSNLNFERAPFKLTDEFVELMGGPRSATFRYFRSLCIRAYLALRRNMDKIVLLVEMMLVGNEDLPCFAGGKRAVIEGLRERFKPGARTSECQLFVNQLIDRSTNNWRTRWYDKYQRAWVGIL